jgi:hypothetical protein
MHDKLTKAARGLRAYEQADFVYFFIV